MEDGLDGYRRAFAYTTIGKLTRSKFPIAPLDIDPLVLQVFSGNTSMAVSIINEVATSDFNLVINGKGEIDLPPDTDVSPDTYLSPSSNIPVKYKAPKIFPRQPHQKVEKKGRKHQTDSSADRFGDHGGADNTD